LALDMGWAAAMCLPSLGHLAEISARRHNWAAFVPRRGILDVVTLYPLPAYLLWPLLVTALLVLWRKHFPRRSHRAQRPLVSQRRELLKPLVLLTCWFAVPLVVAWGVTWTDVARLFLRRYTLVSFIDLPLATAYVWASLPRFYARAVYLAVLLVGVQMTDGVARNLFELGRVSRHGRENWRDAVAWVNRRTQEMAALDAHTAWPVFIRSGLIESDALRGSASPPLTEFCLLPVASIYPLTGNHRAVVPLPRTDSGNLDDEQLALIGRSGGAWFIVRGPPQVVDLLTTRLLARLAGRHITANLLRRRDFDRITVLEFVTTKTAATSRFHERH